MSVVIGLDAGTTGVKAAAFGIGTAERRVAIREYPLLQPRPGWQVQDPEAILAAATSALAECVAAVGSDRVEGIALSTAMHGLIALDGGRRPLTPLITWADVRARVEARALREADEAAELHRLTGAPVHSMTPLTKLR
jgi:gluconokinase